MSRFVDALKRAEAGAVAERWGRLHARRRRGKVLVRSHQDQEILGLMRRYREREPYPGFIDQAMEMVKSGRWEDTDGA